MRHQNLSSSQADRRFLAGREFSRRIGGRLKGAVGRCLLAQQSTSMGSVDEAFGVQRIQIAPQRRQRRPQRLFQLANGHCAMALQEINDALAALRRLQR